MNTPLHQQLFSLVLAALVTSGLLGGLDGLARSHEAPATMGVWAAADVADTTTPTATPAIKPAI